MPKAAVQAAFDCKHVTPVDIDVDADVRIPDDVRGLGKCADCMEETNLIAISGVQPQSDGTLVLDSVFWMPIEGK
jgi:hypothetical protein